jgi:hypothetical protein
MMTPAMLQGPQDIPDNVIPIIGIIFGTTMMMVLGYPIVRAVIRWIERRSEPAALPPDLGARLDRIEQTVESIAVEIERVAESQRFLTRLQTEARSVGAGQQPPR